MLNLNNIKNIKNIPSEPGCYLFVNKKNEIIYIGKAKNIKKRVSSYFQKRDLDTKTRHLVKNITGVEYFITANEKEALILENTLIKKHHPKYNIDLKDSKRFAFIKLSDEKFPRFSIARNRNGKGQFFGPFVLGIHRDYILKLINRTFKLRTCKKLPKKACLRYHINSCSAPCIGKIGEPEYNTDIRRGVMVLKGHIGELINGLSKEMKNAAQDTYFERAIRLREQINSLKSLKNRQNMERAKSYNEDIINYIIDKDRVLLMLFNIYKGVLENRQVFELEHSPLFIEEFLVKYYSDNPVPKEIIIPQTPDKLIIDFINTQSKKKVNFKVPKRGEKAALLNLVHKNIEATYFGNLKKLEDLKDKLLLQNTPHIIECFDISHISGTSTVASMVQFIDGIPHKQGYRKFKIQTVKNIDDFKSIAEVIRRRYTRLKNEKLTMPDLILIDGGKGQLNAALKEMQEIEPDIPVISIAKQMEELFLPGLINSIRLSKKSEALKLLMQIRDEAHRFAITYNRLLRKKKQLNID